MHVRQQLAISSNMYVHTYDNNMHCAAVQWKVDPTQSDGSRSTMILASPIILTSIIDCLGQ